MNNDEYKEASKLWESTKEGEKMSSDVPMIITPAKLSRVPSSLSDRGISDSLNNFQSSSSIVVKETRNSLLSKPSFLVPKRVSILNDSSNKSLSTSFPIQSREDMTFIRDQSLFSLINKMGSIEAEINDLKRIPGLESISPIKRGRSNATGISDRSINLSGLENELKQAEADFHKFHTEEEQNNRNQLDESHWEDSETTFDFLNDGSDLETLRSELDRVDTEYGAPSSTEGNAVQTILQAKSNSFDQGLLEKESFQRKNIQFKGERTTEGLREETEDSFKQRSKSLTRQFSYFTKRKPSRLLSSILSRISEGSENSIGSHNDDTSITSLLVFDESVSNNSLDFHDISEEMMDLFEEKLKQIKFVYKEVVDILIENSLSREQEKERNENESFEEKKVIDNSKPRIIFWIIMACLILVSFFCNTLLERLSLVKMDCISAVETGKMIEDLKLEREIKFLKGENDKLKLRVKDATHLVKDKEEKLGVMIKENLKIKDLCESFNESCKVSPMNTAAESKFVDNDLISLNVVKSSRPDIQILKAEQNKVESQLQRTKEALDAIKLELRIDREKLQKMLQERKQEQNNLNIKYKIKEQRGRHNFRTMKKGIISVQNYIANILLSGKTVFNKDVSQDIMMVVTLYTI